MMDLNMAKKYRHVYISLSVIFIFVLGTKLMEDDNLHRESNSESTSGGVSTRLSTEDAAAPSRGTGKALPARKTFPNIDILPIRNALPNPYMSDIVNLTEYRESVLTFLHNPKSGGTTLKDCISRLASKLGEGSPLLVTPVNREQIQNDFMKDVISSGSYHIMMGGASFGVCDAFRSRKCSYFTILREPYERMISHYFFCKDGGESSIPCENRTIEEFTLEAGSIFFVQLALRVSCSCGRTKNCNHSSSSLWNCRYDNVNYQANIQYKEEYLDYIVQHMDTYFAVIGLTEEYDTTLSILQETFGLPFHDECSGVMRNKGNYGTENKLKSNERKSEAMRQMLSSRAVYDTLYPDVLLYRRAKEIYETQIKKLLLNRQRP